MFFPQNEEEGRSLGSQHLLPKLTFKIEDAITEEEVKAWHLRYFWKLVLTIYMLIGCAVMVHGTPLGVGR